jgi:hypothetical protein
MDTVVRLLAAVCHKKRMAGVYIGVRPSCLNNDANGRNCPLEALAGASGGGVADILRILSGQAVGLDAEEQDGLIEFGRAGYLGYHVNKVCNSKARAG